MEQRPKSIRYYADSHIAKAAVIQLRRKGIDALHCDEVGRSSAGDIQHLEYASQQGRVLVSQDRDFVTLNTLWQRQSWQHAGIMLLPTDVLGQRQVSFVVRELTAYAEMINVGAGTLENDIENRLIWL